MNNDRELLELAAKAVGFTGKWSKTLGGWDCLVLDNGHVWQPHHDDGDALRLAQKLRLRVEFWQDGAGCEMEDGHFLCQEIDEHNPYTATRRAIVRAAADIGRQMQEGGAA